jgi:predicted membrane-bound dolichyl-phosphate-mannose-protein mannosyltransferase
LPGHPVNEFIYSIFWGNGPWLFNFFSALCSVICFVLFYCSAKKLEIKNALLASLALVFTPVVYINSTCTIDYLWALMFALAAFYFLIGQRLFWAGLLLGLAVGCRINSAILYLPFLLWLF